MRRLVELHGGTVQASSGGGGNGQRLHGAAETVAAAAASASDTAGPIGQETAPSTPQKSLIVEDNADTHEMLRMALTYADHDVHEAADGPSGLDAVLTLRPDVALLDGGGAWP